MKIKIIKSNSFYVAGTTVDVPEGRGEYLIRIRIAEKIKEIPEKIQESDYEEKQRIEYVEKPAIDIGTEKIEVKAPKEKRENKTGNVPTAKPKAAKKRKK